MRWVDAQFVFKRGLGFVVLVLLPVKIAKTEIDVGLSRRGLGGSLKFRYRFNGSAQTVQRFPAEHMGSRGIRILLENLAELGQRAGVLLRRQAALRQHAVQLYIFWIRFGGQLEILRGFGEPLGAITA